MSRKPTIKLSYPDASTLAMQLTDAMIRRAPGKRVLETTSEDKAGDGEGSLLDGLNSVRTSTGVEMTLTLEPNSMDYALQQLIRPNLTVEEKKAIFGEDSTSSDQMLPGSAPAEEQTAPDQEKQIEIGKIPDRELRTILADLVDAAQGYVQGGQDAWEKHIENAIETAIKEMDHRAGVIDLDETYEHTPTADLEKIILEALQDHIPDADYITKTGLMSDLAKRINLHERMSKRQKIEKQETSTWLTAILATMIHLAANNPKKYNRAFDAAFAYMDESGENATDDAWTTKAEIDAYTEAAYEVAKRLKPSDPGKVDADKLISALLNEMDPDQYPLPGDEQEKEDQASGENAEAEQNNSDIEPGLLDDIEDEMDDQETDEPYHDEEGGA